MPLDQGRFVGPGPAGSPNFLVYDNDLGKLSEQLEMAGHRSTRRVIFKRSSSSTRSCTMAIRTQWEIF